MSVRSSETYIPEAPDARGQIEVPENGLELLYSDINGKHAILVRKLSGDRRR